ncbi:MAG: hypothetical protein WD009_12185 [Phycisphaeraceae bacterium]
MNERFDTLPCDLSNPGHFFACCGLMEIAALLDPEVTARFTGGGFWMSVAPADALAALIAADLAPVPLPEGSRRARGGQPRKIAPLHIAVDSSILVVDWWLHEGVADFKSWSGGQSASDAALKMHEAIGEMGPVADVLDRAVPASLKPYYYDCRAGGNAVDLGFMDSDLVTTVYAGTELLAFIGLQRFRPAPAGTRWGRRYATWSRPLPIELAMAAAACVLPPLEQERWHFDMTWRDAAGRYKAFGRAYSESIPLTARSDDHGKVGTGQV